MLKGVIDADPDRLYFQRQQQMKEELNVRLSISQISLTIGTSPGDGRLCCLRKESRIAFEISRAPAHPDSRFERGVAQGRCFRRNVPRRVQDDSYRTQGPRTSFRSLLGLRCARPSRSLHCEQYER